jgi:hypothetical protein
LSVTIAGGALAQKTVKLGGDDNYSTQNLTVGDKLVVKLSIDRTGGYAWQPANLETAVLAEDAVKPKSGPTMQTFAFTAAGPGVTTLTLNNVKKSDPDHPQQIYQVMVGVSSKPGQVKADYVAGHFAGPLPCADCPGIDVDLKLYAHAPNQFVDTIYTKTTKYLGKDKSTVEKGTWVMLPGTAADPQATVYALTPDTGGATEFYWLKNEEQLAPLDAEKKPLTGPMDMTMTVVK